MALYLRRRASQISIDATDDVVVVVQNVELVDHGILHNSILLPLVVDGWRWSCRPEHSFQHPMSTLKSAGYKIVIVHCLLETIPV